MKSLTLFFVGFVILLTPIFSQQPVIQDSTVFNAMNKIRPLSGEWSGKGWIQMGMDKRTFTQTEKVIQKANGTVIVIDGLGQDEITKKTVHEAFAVISYDLINKKYLIRAFLANGNYIDADIRVDDDGTIIWGYKHPQAGEIKYTIKVANGKWDEKGEMNRDGVNWILFFQMNLEKVL
jgi:hypothetical protein